MVRGVVAAGVRRTGVVGRFRVMLLGFRRCMRLGSRVRRVVRLRSFLGNGRSHGNDNKTKQEDESP